MSFFIKETDNYHTMPKVRTSWKPGQSGNLNGRPTKGYSITEWFKNMLASKPEIKDAIGKSIINKALEGDTVAQKLVWQYMDGMPEQPMKVVGDIDKPLGVVLLPTKDYEQYNMEGTSGTAISSTPENRI